MPLGEISPSCRGSTGKYSTYRAIHPKVPREIVLWVRLLAVATVDFGPALGFFLRNSAEMGYTASPGAKAQCFVRAYLSKAQQSFA